jgi:hypothetical protein
LGRGDGEVARAFFSLVIKTSNSEEIASCSNGVNLPDLNPAISRPRWNRCVWRRHFTTDEFRGVSVGAGK